MQLITVNCLNKQTLNTAATGFSLFLQNKAKEGKLEKGEGGGQTKEKWGGGWGEGISRGRTQCETAKMRHEYTNDGKGNYGKKAHHLYYLAWKRNENASPRTK